MNADGGLDQVSYAEGGRVPGSNQLREGCVDRAAAPRQEDRRRSSRDDRPEGGRRGKGLRHGNQKGPIERNLKVKLEYLQGRLFPIISF